MGGQIGELRRGRRTYLSRDLEENTFPLLLQLGQSQRYSFLTRPVPALMFKFVENEGSVSWFGKRVCGVHDPPAVGIIGASSASFGTVSRGLGTNDGVGEVPEEPCCVCCKASWENSSLSEGLFNRKASSMGDSLSSIARLPSGISIVWLDIYSSMTWLIEG